jgi:hypothetical protein
VDLLRVGIALEEEENIEILGKKIWEAGTGPRPTALNISSSSSSKKNKDEAEAG